ncbi:MAG: DNA helicase RecQ [Chitinivibrionales bacterium]|nr:DNA helicase RecQ [Chitinivibrionales bacterium]
MSISAPTYPIDSAPVDESAISAALHKYFGFGDFRPHQREIVRSILDKRDNFVVMPTGGGKSLCYQLPACLGRGACVVISPLLSLMKDQVDAANDNGIRAASYNSAIGEPLRRDALRRLNRSELDLLYVSPERFTMDSFRDTLLSADVNLIAIDEAHCISEWGHDFRPDYLALAGIVDLFPRIPIAAFTATATMRVQNDIITRLRLREPRIVRASFDRPNLNYSVIEKDDVESQLLCFVRERENQAGIIYRTTRADVEATAEFLQANGQAALAYHAGLDDAIRARNQDAFNKDEVPVVVATIAFGMGIDKSNIRYILHGDLPKNMESYYQETGRAGRDGEPAECVLFYRRGDIPKITHFINQVVDERERQRLHASLQTMINYGGTLLCRHKAILAHFNEDYPHGSCNACDVCNGAVETVDGTVDAQKILSAIVRTGQRFGAGHIIDIVAGADTVRIRKLHHDRIKTYGSGKNKQKMYWKTIVDELLAQEVIQQTQDQYPTLRLGSRAHAILKGEHPFSIVRKQEPKSVSKPKQTPAGVYDEALFERLRRLRSTLAREHEVPPYIIFSDKTLHDMAQKFPSSIEEMLLVNGVGEAKFARYGADFMREIDEYVSSHPGAPASAQQRLDSSSAASSRPATIRRGVTHTTDQTYKLVQEGFTIGEIADQRELRPSTIYGHVEELVKNRKVADISRFVSDGQRKKLTGLFRKLGTASLRTIVEHPQAHTTYEEARLVRTCLQIGQ